MIITSFYFNLQKQTQPLFSSSPYSISTSPLLTDSMDFKIAASNVRGLGKVSKQNAVKNLIVEENLSICDVLETRLEGQNIKSMAVLCLIEVLSTKERFFCTFIYAENNGRLRRKLWADLIAYKSMSNNSPLGYIRRSKCESSFTYHLEGISYKTHDMEDFQDCVNAIKVDDICSSGLHYTWTKSLLNPNASVLKKIDRVMGNEEYLEVRNRAHVVFLPYGISDHSPVVLTYP
ncbi:RNA-directed DNA polymerase, eukaryota, reverse transcriptase zinc-binding domain protein [Tanacetum coccineum]